MTTEILNIAHLGNPILRETARSVEDFTEPDFQKLINSLLLTVQANNGVGIAAPQVAKSYRLFIIASRPNPRYPNAPSMEPTVAIDPKIVGYSGEMVKGWEGCLSVPGWRGLIPRDRAIQVEYLTRDGRYQRREFRDFLARIFQHELDHLNGILFLDRVESNQDIFTEAEYQKIIE
jgi:peptide deformylase